MRIRSIRPEFWRSDDVSALAIPDRLLFVGLWSYVDDNGVGRDDIAAIIGDLFARDMVKDPRGTVERVSGGLASLADRGMIVRYEAEGKSFLYVTAWTKHQRIDKPGKQRYPLPTCENAPVRETVATPSRGCRDTVAPGEGEKGRRGEGEKSPRTRATQLPDSWTPSPEHADRARATDVDLDRELVKFRAYCEERGKTAVSWNAAFTRWLMNAADFATRNARATGSRPAAAPVSSGWGRGVPADPYGLNGDQQP